MSSTWQEPLLCLDVEIYGMRFASKPLIGIHLTRSRYHLQTNWTLRSFMTILVHTRLLIQWYLSAILMTLCIFIWDIKWSNDSCIAYSAEQWISSLKNVSHTTMNNKRRFNSNILLIFAWFATIKSIRRISSSPFWQIWNSRYYDVRRWQATNENKSHREEEEEEKTLWRIYTVYCLFIWNVHSHSRISIVAQPKRSGFHLV